MNFNNRMPDYQEKKFTPRVVFHREVKDGKSIFVKGKKPNPYKDVSCESMKLKSRIDTGVFESHEGAARQLERANGSDIMTAEIEKEQKRQQEIKESLARKKYAENLYNEVFKDKQSKENPEDN